MYAKGAYTDPGVLQNVFLEYLLHKVLTFVTVLDIVWSNYSRKDG